ncbi:FAD-dependent oxidoreductase (plasmid) [Rhodococcus sp. USK10]|uniref:FAD-dependent oxidoreductase n=1 Tax=Rhodococcus sp. USK10 TaxID=2789739 RepID=UPI001C5EE7A4|nr:FAD-dependent oxidoreductase [Rhodococcus sp. USK10]QYB00148.1 FAD-dependent oxidoreductase [Rhodococcus sp. USK10]
MPSPPNAPSGSTQPAADRTSLPRLLTREPTPPPAPRKGPALPTIAVVGAGPSGAFATAELLRDPDTRIDVFDRLPTPFGLIRYGVAPDHFRIKSVGKVLTRTLGNPRVRFAGNVDLGRHITVDDLRANYHAVVLATGAQHSRRLGIPGENLTGNHAAADIVSWYNGHPLCGSPLAEGSSKVAVIGAGNVSLDVARVLLKAPDSWSETDVPATVLDALGRTRVSDVHIIIRRGVTDTRFTPAELTELENIEGLHVAVDPSDTSLTAEEQATYDADSMVRERVDIFRRWASVPTRDPAATVGKTLRFWFRQHPSEIVGTDRVEAIRLHRASTEATPSPDLTREARILEVQAVIRSIGYLGEPIAGVPFDEQRGLIPNQRGRVAQGLYVAGWIKRGPSGIIGSNKQCATETINTLRADLAGAAHQPVDEAVMLRRLRDQQVRVVSWNGWTDIDAAETALGTDRGCSRTKIEDLDRLLDIGAPPRRPSARTFTSRSGSPTDHHTPCSSPDKIRNEQ